MKKIILIIFAIIFGQIVKAQQIPLNNFYLNNPFIFNPAATGLAGNLTAYADYTDQWTGLKNAPENANFGVHGLITSAMGIGLQFSNSRLGIFKRNKVRLNYSYRLVISREQTLGMGLSLGLQENSINMDRVESDLMADPALYSTNFNEALFEAGLGVHYTFRDLNVHLSAPILYGNEVKKVFRNVFAMASYEYKFPDKIWSITPTAFYRYSDYKHLVDMVVRGAWQNKIMVQAGYRTNKNIIAGAGINLKGLHIFYIYEVNRTQFKTDATGGHQILLLYETPFSVSKKKPYYNYSRRRSNWD